MDRPWTCPICERLFELVKKLAEHFILWHDEWLVTKQVPPLPAVRSRHEPFTSPEGGYAPT